MNTEFSRDNGAGIVAELMKELHEPKLLTVEADGITAQVVAVPNGASGVSLKGVRDFVEPYRANPERRTGTANLETLDSLIAHVNRFKDKSSVLYCTTANKQHPSITAVLDYHHAGDGLPRFCKHKAHYAFPLSEEWEAWNGKNNQALSQEAFATFLDQHITDVLDPERATPETQDLVVQLNLSLATPAQLMAFSRELEVNVDMRVKSKRNLQSGEVQVEFQEDHTDGKGNLLRVPGAFIIGIPLFSGSDDAWQILCRLGYRVQKDGSAKIHWAFTMHRPERVFQAAISEAAERVETETELPLLFGQPER